MAESNIRPTDEKIWTCHDCGHEWGSRHFTKYNICLECRSRDISSSPVWARNAEDKILVCRRCGERIPDKALHCPGCGIRLYVVRRPLEFTPAKPPRRLSNLKIRSPKKRNQIIGYVGLGMIVIGLVGFVLFVLGWI